MRVDCRPVGVQEPLERQTLALGEQGGSAASYQPAEDGARCYGEGTLPRCPRLLHALQDGFLDGPPARRPPVRLRAPSAKRKYATRQPRTLATYAPDGSPEATVGDLPQRLVQGAS